MDEKLINNVYKSSSLYNLSLQKSLQAQESGVNLLKNVEDKSFIKKN